MRHQREKVLVIIDEAQNLDPETMEGLRLLSNLAQPGGQVLQVILAGQPGLRTLVSSPELKQLEQRIRVHYELETLSPQEVGEYIQHRLTVAGRSGQLFQKDALQRIFRFSQGVPRLVNQYANKALLSAFVEESKVVRGSHVDQEDISLHGEDRAPAEEPAPPVIKKISRSQDAIAAQEKINLSQIRDSRRAIDRRSDVGSGRKKGRGKQESSGWMLQAVAVVVAFFMNWFGFADFLKNEGGLNLSPQASVQKQEPIPAQARMEAGLPEDREEVLDQSRTALPAQEMRDNATKPAEKPVTQPDAQTRAQVAADPPPSANPVVAKPVPKPVSRPKVLHVASFRSPDQARSLIERLAVEGVSGYVKSQPANGTVWYRVYLGPFADAATASRIGQSLKDQEMVLYYRLQEVDGS